MFKDSHSVITSMRPPSGHAQIYGLTDVNGVVRYVGKTEACAVSRLRTHWRSARARPPAKRSHKEAWLCSLDAKPGIVILETCLLSEWGSAEQRWIRDLREQGNDLTNCAPGGEGRGAGWHWSEEDKQRIGSYSRGKKHPSASVERRAALLKGQTRSVEQRENISRGRKGIGWSQQARLSAQAVRSCVVCRTGPYSAQGLGYHRRTCGKGVTM